MQEVVLDTETTGLSVKDGHRIVEIGCIEIDNLIPTSKKFHCYLNPERKVSEKALEVHGYTDKFLSDKKKFKEIADDFLKFIEEKKLIIHNAEFDIKFLNAELKAFGYPSLRLKDHIDTLQIARQKFPGSPANLDALCRRFGIDNTNRELHGALLDSQLLAEVYLELMGGRQHGLSLARENMAAAKTMSSDTNSSGKPFREPRQFLLNDNEKQAHAEFLAQLSDPLWEKYDS